MRVRLPGEEGEIPATPKVDFTPNERENAIIAQVAPQFREDPSGYIALPVQVVVNQAIQCQVAPMRGASGAVVEMVMVPFMLVLPLDNLKGSTVLGPNGQMADPLMGMLPVMEARLVLPRHRLKAEILKLLEDGTVNPVTGQVAN